MLTRRLIVCLDVNGGRVVKGTKFLNLRDMGDPVELARRYADEGADEVVFLDISATLESRAATFEVIEKTANVLFVPLTVGGGIKSAQDAALALNAGADKVAVNSAAVHTPEILTEMSQRFGSQCVVASIDCDRDQRVVINAGTKRTDKNAVLWARECQELGAGEVLVTSIERDGTREGYDIALLSALRPEINVPIVASGGAGTTQDVVDALQVAQADAALVAGIVHDGSVSVQEIKRAMDAAGIATRVSV